MKLKGLTFFALVLSVLVFSCNKIKNLTAVDVETELSADITLEPDTEAKSALASQKYSYKGTGTIDLKDNAAVKNFIGGIQKVVASQASMTLNGLTENDSITELNLSYSFNPESTFSTLISASNLTSTSLSTDLSNIQQLLDDFKDAGFESVILFKINGKSNFDVSSKPVKVKIKAPSTVTYNPL